MQKKSILMGLLLMVIPILCLFSQNVERITYMDIGADGSQRINRTVNAIFAGWLQMEVKQEGNLRVTYQAMRLVDNEWTDFELSERRPMQGTLNQQYDALVRDYTLLPNVGTIMPIPGGVTALKMMAIPTGETKPMWWGTNGRSFFIFYRLYIVVP
jgi:hypothetical protein